ncbi:hypothetical protein [Enterococcus faecalis]|uniref:hypothetical protein n=1 Tax=Enterococcus faecalis TaxID=1351 RepID=UPI000352FC3D|nr:hypothetical protein [Enterococcus faecalis]EGO6642699.1 hypothetical protein [Enterococcus faecalis]EHQ8834484.1 hypothetical protein [Enterococcus faecalis]EIP8061115.1 hypothetical protein [Enterococcus faecalis]EPH69969.1 hypothetical protein D928_02103 [Enterococcus faecalis 20-SD-BW-06]EPI02014.1 hypothetical protein D919_01241 [Enterococcus faecalis 20-SD-BW-08]
MAKLRDLVNVNVNVEHIEIQGEKIPIMFSMSALDYIQEAYGKPYPIFERDLNNMMKQKQVTLRGNELKLIRSLMYGMVRAGGTECTIKELEGAIAINEIVSAYETVMDVFMNGNFQQKDLETVKKQPKNRNSHNRNRNNRKR